MNTITIPLVVATNPSDPNSAQLSHLFDLNWHSNDNAGAELFAETKELAVQRVAFLMRFSNHVCAKPDVWYNTNLHTLNKTRPFMNPIQSPLNASVKVALRFPARSGVLLDVTITVNHSQDLAVALEQLRWITEL